MTNQISKIQLRRGLQSDLPGSSNLGLDVGEVAFTTDTNRLFVGSDPTTSTIVARVHGAQSNAIQSFPYSNIEVLTEFSPVNQTIFDSEARNITTAFIISLPMAITGGNTWAPVLIQQISSLGGPVEQVPFVINAQTNTGQFGCAQISYYVVDSLTKTPMRNGVLKVFFQGNAFPPSLVDESVSNPYAGFSTGGLPVDPNQRYGMIAFKAVPINTGISIQYQINISGSNLPVPVMYFRVESPFLETNPPVTPASNTITMINTPTPTSTIIVINENSAIPYDVVGDLLDSPLAGETFLRFIFVRSVSFSAGLTGSKSVCLIPPTNVVSIVIAINNVSVGSINFAAGATNGSFTFTNTTIVMPGDILTLTGPNPADPTFNTISYTLSGTIVP